MPLPNHGYKFLKALSGEWKLDNATYEKNNCERVSKVRENMQTEGITISGDVVRTFFTPSQLIDDLYYTLDVLHQVFSFHGITYWATFGTLLGYVRHGGIIPWDTDADICTMEDDREKILLVQDVLLANGLVVTPKRCHMTKTYTDRYFEIKKGESGPMVDIFFCAQTEDTIRQLNYWGDIEPTTAHVDEIFPVDNVQFGGITISVPCSAADLTKRMYGEECLTKGILGFNNHADGTVYERSKQTFDMEEFVGHPAVSSYRKSDKMTLVN